MSQLHPHVLCKIVLRFMRKAREWERECKRVRWSEKDKKRSIASLSHQRSVESKRRLWSRCGRRRREGSRQRLRNLPPLSLHTDFGFSVFFLFRKKKLKATRCKSWEEEIEPRVWVCEVSGHVETHATTTMRWCRCILNIHTKQNR